MDRIRMLADELSIIQQSLTNRDLIGSVLDGLNLDYDVIVNSVQTMAHLIHLRNYTICGKIGHSALPCCDRHNYAQQADDLPTAFSAMSLSTRLRCYKSYGPDDTNMEHQQPYTGYDQVTIANGRKASSPINPMSFLGYGTPHKGYRCLDLKTGTVYFSGHVRFNEEVFPFVQHRIHDYLKPSIPIEN
ncbi:hypothetical protein AgCh_000924 [Apium graveolens]